MQSILKQCFQVSLSGEDLRSSLMNNCCSWAFNMCGGSRHPVHRKAGRKDVGQWDGELWKCGCRVLGMAEAQQIIS